MPLSRDPDKRSRQLANLRSAPAAPSGNRRALRHGGYARIAAERLDEKVAEVFDALVADAPLRDADGGLPEVDHAAVHLAAEALCRLEDVRADVALRGVVDQRTGGVRPVVELERRLRLEALDYLEALGMTPRSRSRLGLELMRTRSAGEQLEDHLADRYGGDA